MSWRSVTHMCRFGFLTPVLTQLFFPKPPTTFLTCFCRAERRKYAGKKVHLNRGSNSQPPGHESDTLTTEPPGRSSYLGQWLFCSRMLSNWTGLELSTSEIKASERCINNKPYGSSYWRKKLSCSNYISNCFDQHLSRIITILPVLCCLCSGSPTILNPFPINPSFLRVCSTRLLKTLWEKEKLLVTSNFSFSRSIFYPF